MKYRKKPVVINAYLIYRIILFRNAPEALPFWIQNSIKNGYITVTDTGIRIHTLLEGTMWGHSDDWLIMGVNSELYPCKPDIFAKTYEAVESTTEQEMK
jgi:hypothetical protein